MAKKFGFFNSINGDRKYLASDIAEAFGIGITTGLKSEEGNLQVVPYQNMQIKINPGGAMIFGHFYLNDEEEIIDIDIADGELNRIDRVVLRYDKYERSIKTVIMKGTPALTPAAPTRLETAEQFDLVLADIYVPKATTSITTSNITDMRESELCGYIGVKGAVSNLEFQIELDKKASKAMGETFEAVLQNGWTGTLKYSKNDLGQVWLRGVVTVGTVGNIDIASIPSNFGSNNYFSLGLAIIYGSPFSSYSGIRVATDGIIGIRPPLVGNISPGDQLVINIIFQGVK